MCTFYALDTLPGTRIHYMLLLRAICEVGGSIITTRSNETEVWRGYVILPEDLYVINGDNEFQPRFILQGRSNNTGSYFRIT